KNSVTSFRSLLNWGVLEVLALRISFRMICKSSNFSKFSFVICVQLFILQRKYRFLSPNLVIYSIWWVNISLFNALLVPPLLKFSVSIISSNVNSTLSATRKSPHTRHSAGGKPYFSFNTPNSSMSSFCFSVRTIFKLILSSNFRCKYTKVFLVQQIVNLLFLKTVPISLINYSSIIFFRCAIPHSVRLLIIVCRVKPCSVNSYCTTIGCVSNTVRLINLLISSSFNSLLSIRFDIPSISFKKSENLLLL